ncbi:MAG: lysylphosphatidylglycerol synthase transmembrane domain-containing protein [Candidatus Manganitrophus sp.]|nr:lysylphosphatidylglycerol synthase transmembrane domain-containing protein [Candidatus Manganitrophus sp.]MDC4223268.1 lysylphosphatidylglycerol synthase transmembrane domain-containing protein [Candidatus Manganitrophus sp.]WDT71630.1 MAG: lysylphosphatidylglycerol synthase transmembrane domain-containing protein [Candidatus Manganitrophus sp.]WDT76120.1 MAG: lysylphosphatidylglycerol synthase transmembrane domain-containing protein [Candidatus Manganitrophus sp.]WDT81022.1 MAG: lysylphosph
MIAEVLQGRKLYTLMGSIAAAAFGYLAFSLWGGWREVLAAFDAVGTAGLLIVLVLSLVNYSLRFVRWQFYLSALGYPVPAVPSGLIYISGFALTTTPGKAGELLRGIFLKTRGMPYKQSTAAFLSERLSDLVAVVLLAMLGGTLYPQGGITVLIGIAVVGTGLLLLSQKKWLIALGERTSERVGRPARVIHQLMLLLIEASRCLTPTLLLSATVLSLVAWSAEAYAFHLILHWMGFEVSLSFAFSVYALAMLAGGLSFLPGGLGSAEAVMVGLLLWSGMPEARAVAATMIIRLATLWFAVALGGAVLVFGGRTLKGEVVYAKV